MVSETPIDGRCNYEYSPDDDYKHNSGYCEASPMDNGKCYHHGGQNYNGGAPEGNTNAATVGAWSESFVTDFLTDKEIKRVENAAEALGEPQSAKELSRQVAAICLEQFRRTGDDRFLRRYESISDKFGLTPPDEHKVEHTGSGLVIDLGDNE